MIIYINGDIYNGEYVNDKREGEGEYKSSDGVIYKGKWLNDMKHGEGILKNRYGTYISKCLKKFVGFRL